MLRGKTIILGVSGSIAAYKIANLASALVKLHADVHVIMTQNATNFIHPITFETLTGNKCLVDTFDRNFQFEVEHVSLAKAADIMVIAPASANVIAKLAHGIADDMLTTTALAFRGPMVIAPAMNTNMYTNPICQNNLEILKSYGKEIIAPAAGRLACGDVGEGKMPEPEELLPYILRHIGHVHDMEGKRVLVSAGPTREALDPVRFISNHSTGKMGYAIAKCAMLRGAEVTLVSGPVFIAPPEFVKVVPVTTAAQMFDAMTQQAQDADIVIMTAAVADYRPAVCAHEKIKKNDGSMEISLEKTADILQALGERKSGGQFLCGFSMETENLLENSKEKLKKKHLDMIVANNLKVEGAGFGCDTNVVTLITENGEQGLPLMSKDEVAEKILDAILKYGRFGNE